MILEHTLSTPWTSLGPDPIFKDLTRMMDSVTQMGVLPSGKLSLLLPHKVLTHLRSIPLDGKQTLLDGMERALHPISIDAHPDGLAELINDAGETFLWIHGVA